MSPFREKAGESGGRRSVRVPYPVKGGSHRNRLRRGVTGRITEQRPDERVSWTSLEGPTHAGVVTFRRLDATTTRVTVRLEIDPERFAERAGARLGALGRRVKGDLRRFKTVVESGGARGTGGRSGRVRRTAPRGL
ncbi:SRPBCC family protein [Actinomadura hallensis]|uniref:SRPBCC family protein n=1 Tax=Actinomadura hallensis TaxID=337895 RepID=UPI00319D8BB2